MARPILYAIWILLLVLLAIGFLQPPFSNAMTPNSAAAGWLSAGQFSAGVLSAGLFSVGVFSAGLFSVGIFSAGVFSLGVFSVGNFAIGWWVWSSFFQRPDNRYFR